MRSTCSSVIPFRLLEERDVTALLSTDGFTHLASDDAFELLEESASTALLSTNGFADSATDDCSVTFRASISRDKSSIALSFS